jgi:hypothetical protein
MILDFAQQRPASSKESPAGHQAELLAQDRFYQHI